MFHVYAAMESIANKETIFIRSESVAAWFVVCVVRFIYDART